LEDDKLDDGLEEESIATPASPDVTWRDTVPKSPLEDVSDINLNSARLHTKDSMSEKAAIFSQDTDLSPKTRSKLDQELDPDESISPSSKRIEGQPLIKLTKLPSSDKVGSGSLAKGSEKKGISTFRRDKSLKSIDKQNKEEVPIAPPQAAKSNSRILSATIEQNRRLKEKSTVSSKETGSTSNNVTVSGPSLLSIQTTTINSSTSHNKRSIKDKSMEEGHSITSPKSIPDKTYPKQLIEAKIELNPKIDLNVEEKGADQGRSLSEKPKKLEKVITESIQARQESETIAKESAEDTTRKKGHLVLSEKHGKKQSKVAPKCDKTPDSSFVAAQKASSSKVSESRSRVT
jgi:hypothetical protein